MIKRIILIIGLLISCSLTFAQVKVRFVTGNIPVFKTSAKNIFLAGDFNNWNPADTTWQLKQSREGKYMLIKNMTKGNYGFKTTKGSWDMVESKLSGKDIDNRNIVINNDTTVTLNIEAWKDDQPVQQKQHTASANVHIITENFDMPQLGRQRRVWIYLPADYATSHKKYPVIYMHDGQNLFDEFTAGYGEWGVDEILDKLSVDKQCIVVGIDHGGEHRLMEYNPYDSKYGKGEGDKYVDFLVNTLKPYIDEHYRTKKQAKYTTVAGSSMGGLISAYAVLKYPDVFGNAGIFSPAFWIASNIYTYAQGKNISSKTRFYFVCGDIESKDMVGDMKKMIDILAAKGVTKANDTYVIMPGYKHSEKQWNVDFPAFYNWLQSGY
jgi:predicted alpha/beta superfamily hydrolase